MNLHDLEVNLRSKFVFYEMVSQTQYKPSKRIQKTKSKKKVLPHLSHTYKKTLVFLLWYLYCGIGIYLYVL